MTNLESRVSISLPNRLADTELYDITSAHGSIAAIYRSTGGFYQIADFEVHADSRGLGHGKELLHSAALHARELGARTVYAAIISRECYEVMKREFGEESLEVLEMGDPTPDGQDQNKDSPTAAFLFHHTK
ncbi:GNAT family N-acetyltransferase [Candidatus Mycosynbacter amalyticus]|uniref:GNAT family N-acetyltransferase n=1 Tax=Candidatus Mycosynbacter amalyticus TaxID=2665156 RepID=A0A857MMY9_9BACT|nr:GNAT family N-acetyltransferase [Candidatus Mycosynbacter amalyticus]QHN42942.1 GNAT family N-acetyltransferase [Candidatus Mycosynbacter amalyticus]